MQDERTQDAGNGGDAFRGGSVDDAGIAGCGLDSPPMTRVSAFRTMAGEYSILVVDDSELDRKIVGEALRQQAQARVRYAKNGLEALAAIERELPDLVLTDLNMPQMDGLELVGAIRNRYPLVPIVLMTAHGNEETAVAALRCGAATYVPKHSLARRLLETVADVLAVSRLHREQSRLRGCWSQTEFTFSLGNDARLIPPLVAHLQNYVGSVRESDETELFRLGIALHEALRNAMHHGNLELSSQLRRKDPDEYYREAERRSRQHPFRDRKVRLTAVESPAISRYVIEDDGPGFDTSSVFFDPEAGADLERNDGRGLFLIRAFMNEVYFNERGNVITMVRRRGETA